MGFFTKLFARTDAPDALTSAFASQSEQRLSLLLIPAVVRMAHCDKDSTEETNALIKAALTMKAFADRAYQKADSGFDIAILISAAFISARRSDPKTAMASLTHDLSFEDRKVAIHLALKGALLSPKREIWDIGFLSGLARLLDLNDAEFETIFDRVRQEIR